MNFLRSLLPLSLLIWTHSGRGAEFWVAPGGAPDADGSREAPWDIATALSGERPLPPGATVWLREGAYRCPDRSPNGAFHLLRHRGTAERPILFRAAPGERATIDGGLAVGENREDTAPQHVWIQDLEVTVSETGRRTEQTGSWPSDLGGPFGGVTLLASRNCRLINLVIQGNIGSGLNLWSPAVDAEVYGCIVGNIVSRGALRVLHYESCEIRGNLVVGDALRLESCGPEVEPAENRISRDEADFPDTPRVLLFPNEHDAERAHLAVFNWRGDNPVAVPVAGFLEPGDRYRLIDPADFHGPPAGSGICEGPSIAVSMEGEFAAFVLIRESRGGGG